MVDTSNFLFKNPKSTTFCIYFFQYLRLIGVAVTPNFINNHSISIKFIRLTPKKRSSKPIYD